MTDTTPKPLVRVAGQALLDHVLDKLAAAGVTHAVVNVHHFADQIVAHVGQRGAPQMIVSDERDAILGTGGGVVRAAKHLGEAPFFHLNSDTLWIDGTMPNLARLASAFDPRRMDALLLMAPTTTSIGYAGSGDYALSPEGQLRRRKEREIVPFVYAGAAILAPSLFDHAPEGAFPLTLQFDRAEAAGRLFGLRLDGVWMHVGTPEAVALAEDAIRKSAT